MNPKELSAELSAEEVELLASGGKIRKRVTPSEHEAFICYLTELGYKGFGGEHHTNIKAEHIGNNLYEVRMSR